MICWLSENVIVIITLVGSIIGGIIALIKWNQSIKVRHAEFINQIHEKLRYDEKFVKTMNLIDYGKFVWPFNSEEEEITTDALLALLNYICYLYEIKIITRKELDIFEYKLIRTFNNSIIKEYFNFLLNFSKENNTICSFKYLIDYGIKTKRFFPK